MLRTVLTAAAVVLAVTTNLALATKVRECSDESRGQRLFVDIADCESPPCILKKNTNASVQIKFTPDSDVDMLKNRVFARLIGIPLPFVGVDGESSCDNIFLPSGLHAGCPLQANTEYLYKNSFEIHSFYPSISPMVHWGLRDAATGDPVVCFEVKTIIKP